MGHLFGSPLPKRLKAPWHLDSAATSAWACSPSVGRLGSRRKDRRAKIFARRCCFRGDTPSRRVPEKWRDAASTWEHGRPARKPSPPINRARRQFGSQAIIPAGTPASGAGDGKTAGTSNGGHSPPYQPGFHPEQRKAVFPRAPSHAPWTGNSALQILPDSRKGQRNIGRPRSRQDVGDPRDRHLIPVY